MDVEFNPFLEGSANAPQSAQNPVAHPEPISTRSPRDLPFLPPPPPPPPLGLRFRSDHQGVSTSKGRTASSASGFAGLGPTNKSVVVPRPSKTCEVSNVHGTPVKPKASSHLVQPCTTASQSKPTVASELDGSMASSSTNIDTIYRSYQSPEIGTFLGKCQLYSNNEWSEVKAPGKQDASFLEKRLYQPFFTIIAAILTHFHTNASLSRWVVDTHAVPMKHLEDGTEYIEIKANGTERTITVKTSPDLSIMGTGPYFFPIEDRLPGYDRCISPVEIKRHQSLIMEDVTVQVGVYARQCFIQQPHRRYVTTVVLTEKIVILFVYDRSGVLTSEEIDIHQNPEAFIRIIIGISSVPDDLEHSPIDNRVTWYSRIVAPSPGMSIEMPAPPVEEIFPIIRLKKGLFTEAGVPEVYRITENLFQRRTVLGRATLCWKTESIINNRLVKVLIKESWRAADRPSEWHLLPLIKDLPGVGQILARDEDRDYRISHFRNFIFDGLYENDIYREDRIFTRLVLQAYGASIKYFTSKLQLLEALRDAVAGHKLLWLNGVLHRDVSIENILLGVEGAAEGYRGILIDFDMAINVKRKGNPSGLFRTGTRAFQSYSVLSSAKWKEQSPPQDHLDDLESYFYVLAWICHKFDGPDVSLSPLYLSKWEAEELEDCASAKSSFLKDPVTSLPTYFNTTIFTDLLTELAELCEGYINVKAKAVRRRQTFPVIEKVQEADELLGAPAHDRFLAIIDKAIAAQRLEKEPAHPKHSQSQAQVGVPDFPRDLTPPSQTGPELSDPANHPGADTFVPDRVMKKRPAPDAVPTDARESASKRLKSSGVSGNEGVAMRRSVRLANGQRSVKK